MDSVLAVAVVVAVPVVVEEVVEVEIKENVVYQKSLCPELSVERMPSLDPGLGKLECTTMDVLDAVVPLSTPNGWSLPHTA